MVYPMMVSMNMKALLNKGEGKVQFVAIILNFLVIPLIGYTLGKIFFQNLPLAALGLLLMEYFTNIRNDNLLDRFCKR